MSSHSTRNDPRCHQRNNCATGHGCVIPCLSYPRKDDAVRGLTMMPTTRAWLRSWAGAESKAKRTSETSPSRSPLLSTTSLPSTVVRIIGTPGEPANGVVSKPAFHPRSIERVRAHTHRDYGVHTGHDVPRNTDQPVRRRPAAEDPRAQYRTCQQCRYARRCSTFRDGLIRRGTDQLEVIDCGDGHAVDVQHLPVQQVQLGVQDQACRARRRPDFVRLDLPAFGRTHAPAPVTIMSGMAAKDAARMITKYTNPAIFTALLLTCSPIYWGSFATIRIGRWATGRAIAENTPEYSATRMGATPVARP